MDVDPVVDHACSMCDVQGSTKLVVLGMLGAVLILGVVRFCVLLRLKYHEGAVKMMGDVFGAVSMRTANSW